MLCFGLLPFMGCFRGPITSFLTLRDTPALQPYPQLQEMTTSSHRRIGTSAKLGTYAKGRKLEPSQDMLRTHSRTTPSFQL